MGIERVLNFMDNLADTPFFDVDLEDSVITKEYQLVLFLDIEVELNAHLLDVLVPNNLMAYLVLVSFVPFDDYYFLDEKVVIRQLGSDSHTNMRFIFRAANM